MLKNNKSGYPKNMISGVEAKGALRIRQVLELVPVGQSTLWLWIRQGKFPRGTKIGEKTTVWFRSEIDAFLTKMKDVENAENRDA